MLLTLLTLVAPLCASSAKIFEFNTYLFSEDQTSFKLSTFDAYLTTGKLTKNIVVCSAEDLIEFSNNCFPFKTEMTDLYWLYNHTAFDGKVEISQWENVSGMIVGEESPQSLINLYHKRDDQLIIRIDPLHYNQLSD